MPNRLGIFKSIVYEEERKSSLKSLNWTEHYRAMGEQVAMLGISYVNFCIVIH